MAREILLRSQQNDVLHAIVRVGLDPSDFEFAEWPSGLADARSVSVLQHKPSADYWFIFERGINGGHYAIFSPGSETTREEQYPGPWEGQMGYVQQWLTYLRRETEAPDLWAALAAGPSTQTGTSNAPFTPTELKAISERLALIERRIGEVKQLQQGEAQYVRESLEYLKTEAKSAGRRNWINMAIGVIFNLVIFLAIPPNLAGALFQFGVAQLQGLGIALGNAPAPVPPAPLPGPPPRRT